MRVNAKVTGTFEQRAEQAAQKAARIVLAELFGRFQASLAASVWQWPRVSRRTSGTAGTIRNIIDTGNLRASGHFQYTGKFYALYSWSANYATAVHEGARLANGGLLPARPWTAAVTGTLPASGIKVFPLGERSKALLVSYLRR